MKTEQGKASIEKVDGGHGDRGGHGDELRDVASMPYEIVHNPDGIWTADGLGSPNSFVNPDEAENAIGNLIALGDEWRAGTYAVRKIGCRYIEPGTRTEGPDEICIYCGAQVPRADVPAGDDDGGWAELAAAHLDGCEWTATRAHRIEVRYAK